MSLTKLTEQVFTRHNISTTSINGISNVFANNHYGVITNIIDTKDNGNIYYEILIETDCQLSGATVCLKFKCYPNNMIAIFGGEAKVGSLVWIGECPYFGSEPFLNTIFLTPGHNNWCYSDNDINLKVVDKVESKVLNYQELGQRVVEEIKRFELGYGVMHGKLRIYFQDLTDTEFNVLIEKLMAEGVIYSPENYIYRVVDNEYDALIRNMVQQKDKYDKMLDSADW